MPSLSLCARRVCARVRACVCCAVRARVLCVCVCACACAPAQKHVGKSTDEQKEAEEKFRSIQEAYEHLSKMRSERKDEGGNED